MYTLNRIEMHPVNACFDYTPFTKGLIKITCFSNCRDQQGCKVVTSGTSVKINVFFFHKDKWERYKCYKPGNYVTSATRADGVQWTHYYLTTPGLGNVCRRVRSDEPGRVRHAEQGRVRHAEQGKV